ncbi:C40 family peptidase [Antarcticirhabdus aurantiaca]|uniref:NlpC/P60 family protein n=1 Tax=Antarcticirhabdus aurantiaca TaxID=2606717 RepID=A0ACD4NTC6_9HYPH|nr:NlpC/P60 family protein [Antarcticirhabdus aurantiaca]WAJ30136.1 NlpC/P60 family protein [Jeongeuplla avenae]
MTELPDRRLHAFRPDLADIRLEGRVPAERFVEGIPARVSAPLAPLRRSPSSGAMLETEALFGETLRVFETDGEGWSWVQLDGDGYVGYAPADALTTTETPAPTHRVVAPRTLLFPGPDIKLPPLAGLPMGALVTATGEASDHNARYRLVAPFGAIVAQHLEPLDARQDDFPAVAERFLGAPYLWGGKSALGLDCTGLVQVALAMCGIAAPRDSDMQEKALGQALPAEAPRRRGDLVFWRGHVGIMLDEARLLHANAHHMMTAIEPLAEAIARIGGRGTPVSSIRRL